VSNVVDPTKPNRPDGPPKAALGRGLAALLGGAPSGAAKATAPASPGMMSASAATPVEAAPPKQAVPYAKLDLVEVTAIEPNPEQPRKVFDEERLKELSDSLREQGLVQPIVVRPKGDRFEIIAGERRWRAAKLAGIAKIPVIVRTDKNLEISNDLASLVENLQREQLSPLELAGAYERIMNVHKMTQEQVAAKIGVSRVTIANTLRLLRLPEDVKTLLAEGKLSEGHARSLLSLDDSKQMNEVAQKVVMRTLSVRETEQEVRSIKLGLAGAAETGASETKAIGVTSTSVAGDAAATATQKYGAMEEELRQIFGTKVAVRGSADRGSIEIYFSGSDSLHRLIHQIRALKS
jgi:ParB family chromosome partitioning protein